MAFGLGGGDEDTHYCVGVAVGEAQAVSWDLGASLVGPGPGTVGDGGIWATRRAVYVAG